MQQEVLDSIFKFKNKSSQQEIPIQSKKIEFESSKYSSKKNLIWHVYINNIKLNRKSDYTITYTCSDCNKLNEVSTTQFLRKLRNGTHRCNSCAIEILNSKPDHNKPTNKEPVKKLTPIEYHEQSLIEFKTYPDEYRESYILHHLSEEDFNRLRPRIVSICNGKYTDLDRFEFWSIYKVYNQMAFSSILYDKQTKTVLKANQPILKCDNCDKIWRAKSLEGFKNAYKVLCIDCKLCNSIFKIRPIQNVNNEKITYQSKLEKRFVEWCNNNNILVKNGPIINYEFCDKSRIYKVDFQIKNILIEIKDFHCWHKEQIKSGKWKAKEDAAINFINEHNLNDYLIITPHNWDEKLKKIKDILSITPFRIQNAESWPTVLTQPRPQSGCFE